MSGDTRGYDGLLRYDTNEADYYAQGLGDSYAPLAVANLSVALSRNGFEERCYDGPDVMYPPCQAPTDYDVNRGDVVCVDLDELDRLRTRQSMPGDPIVPCFSALRGLRRGARYTVMGVSQATATIDHKSPGDYCRFAVQLSGTSNVLNNGDKLIPAGYLVLARPPPPHTKQSRFPIVGVPRSKVVMEIFPFPAGSIWITHSQICVQGRILAKEHPNYETLRDALVEFVRTEQLRIARIDMWDPIEAFAKLWVLESYVAMMPDADVRREKKSIMASTMQKGHSVSSMSLAARSMSVEANENVQTLEVPVADDGVSPDKFTGGIYPEEMSFTELTSILADIAHSMRRQFILGTALSTSVPSTVCHIHLRRGHV